MNAEEWLEKGGSIPAEEIASDDFTNDLQELLELPVYAFRVIADPNKQYEAAFAELGVDRDRVRATAAKFMVSASSR